MCYNPVTIAPVSPLAPKHQLVPCGHCEECRKAQKSAWSFRLVAEMIALESKGWKIGFGTLTYDDAHLPTIPKSLFKDSADYVKIPCFSRSDVRNFIVNLRRELCDNYAVTGCRYIVCAEYGKTTRRPHYHYIFAWEPKNNVDARLVYSLIQKFWTKNGHVIPRDYQGGYDSKGRYHKPFECVNAVFSARYAAKYVCKDLDFYDTFDKSRILTTTKLWKDCDCFHVQSRSLGLSFLENLTDDQRLSYFLHGYAFVGDEVKHALPTYLKNKLIFDPVYVYENGKRLVRRKAKDFFYAHYKEIFEKRKDFYKSAFERILDYDYLRQNQIPALDAKYLLSEINRAALNADQLASFYLAYYGLSFGQVVTNRPADQWFLRYSDDVRIVYPSFNFARFDECQRACGLLVSVLDKLAKKRLTDAEKQAEIVKDFFNSVSS